jgi:hypothetical protein
MRPWTRWFDEHTEGAHDQIDLFEQSNYLIICTSANACYTSSRLLCKSEDSTDEVTICVSDGDDETAEDAMRSTSRARSKVPDFCVLGCETLLLLLQRLMRQMALRLSPNKRLNSTATGVEARQTCSLGWR